MNSNTKNNLREFGLLQLHICVIILVTLVLHKQDCWFYSIFWTAIIKNCTGFQHDTWKINYITLRADIQIHLRFTDQLQLFTIKQTSFMFLQYLFAKEVKQ